MGFDKCYNCNKMRHEFYIKQCDICKYNSYCINCVPDIRIDFKVIKIYACEECVCNPNEEYISNSIDALIKKLDITKSDFLKILKVEKITKYNSEYFINKTHNQIKRIRNKILKEKEKMDELKSQEEFMIEKLRLISIK